MSASALVGAAAAAAAGTLFRRGVLRRGSVVGVQLGSGRVFPRTRDERVFTSTGGILRTDKGIVSVFVADKRVLLDAVRDKGIAARSLERIAFGVAGFGRWRAALRRGTDGRCRVAFDAMRNRANAVVQRGRRMRGMGTRFASFADMRANGDRGVASDEWVSGRRVRQVGPWPDDASVGGDYAGEGAAVWIELALDSVQLQVESEILRPRELEVVDAARRQAQVGCMVTRDARDVVDKLLIQGGGIGR